MADIFKSSDAYAGVDNGIDQDTTDTSIMYHNATNSEVDCQSQLSTSALIGLICGGVFVFGALIAFLLLVCRSNAIRRKKPIQTEDTDIHIETGHWDRNPQPAKNTQAEGDANPRMSHTRKPNGRKVANFKEPSSIRE